MLLKSWKQWPGQLKLSRSWGDKKIVQTQSHRLFWRPKRPGKSQAAKIEGCKSRAIRRQIHRSASVEGPYHPSKDAGRVSYEWFFFFKISKIYILIQTTPAWWNVIALRHANPSKGLSWHPPRSFRRQRNGALQNLRSQFCAIGESKQKKKKALWVWWNCTCPTPSRMVLSFLL